eukprot:gene11551-11343_t
MALFGDIVGDDENAVAQAASEVIRMANARVGEGFINEDVVIPLDRMGEYTDGIERINIELSIQNKLACIAALKEFVLRGNLPLGKSEDADGDDIPAAELLEDRVSQADQLLSDIEARWTYLLTQLDQPLREAR